MIAMTHDDAKPNGQFKRHLVDSTLHRIYDELNGPLSDAIATIPPK